ncbi:Hsp70 family protein [Dermacoccus abyssi]|uniref:Hsp70 family protein n=1 Tax=Dermacoccus abyssi TaxID=322596 RepID=UPI002AD4B634|nr:Hsp70 family protein [Dermacoccus abyssi]
MSDNVYGIDLGTTYSAISRINDLGQAEVLLNLDGKYTTPSVVFFEADAAAVVGSVAKSSALTDPENVCALIKRHMGTVFPQEFRGQQYTPESISALILKELVKAANSEFGEEVSKVVITVPAYFGVKEKEATKQAGQIAGLEVVGIVTEPVAAALSLRSRDENPETILVYDLGGGTFDTTVLRAEPGKVQVIAIDGNKTLGGADWDEELAQLISDKFVAQAGLGDENPRFDSDFDNRLRLLAEEFKQKLTVRETWSELISYKDNTEQVEVSRAEFEGATQHLVSQTLVIAKRTVEAAVGEVSGLAVDRVLLVGGSSKMPMIAAALRDELGWDPVGRDQDMAVAKGAAIYGQAAVEEVLFTDGEAVPDEVAAGADEKYFLGGSKTLSVTNVLSRGLGVRFVRGDAREPYIGFLVKANQQIPVTPPAVGAATADENQSAVTIALYEQGGETESDRVDDNILLQEASLPIPNLPKGSPIDISVSVTAEGLARVTAFDPAGGKSVDVEAKISVLTEEEIAQATEQVSGISLRS